MADNQPKAYVRRHFVLLSFAFTIFAWNLSGLRHTAIVPSYAFYHDVTNEVSAPPVYGIDSFSLISNIILVFSSVFGAYAIDKFGLKSMKIGSFMLAVASWCWYFSNTNILFVLLSKSLAALFGPIVTASILAISNRWYPPKERAKATAAGSLVSILGGALALVISPLYATQKHEVVELSLRSCKKEALSTLTKNAFSEAQEKSEQLLCTDKHSAARDSFCCYLPVDIPTLNLTMAIISTAAFVFTFIAVKDFPPTPPAPSAEPKRFISVWDGLKRIYSDKRLLQLSISDFLVSGPPLVLFSAVSRIFPSTVSRFSFLASTLGILLAIPASIISGHYLDKKKWFWSFTMLGYSCGTAAWAIGTIGLAFKTIGGAYTFVLMVIIGISAYIAWQTAVYETKLEYAFSEDTAVEGIVVGADRVIINLSSLVFLSSIPPERVGGSTNTFYIGLAIMIIGCLPTAFISDKYRYARQAYDEEEKVKSNESKNEKQNTTQNFN